MARLARGVLVVGHICVDLTPGLDGTPSLLPGDLVATGALRIAPGGSVANTAGALVGCGVPVAVAADVGDDALGSLVPALLGDLGLDSTGIRTVGGSTSYSVVVEPPGVDRTFWHHVGVNASFDGVGVELEGAAARHRFLHLGYPPLLPALTSADGAGMLALLTRAHDAGLTTSVDLAVVAGPDAGSRAHWSRVLTAVLPAVDVCSPSRDDLRSAVGDVVPDAGGPAGLRHWADWLVDRGCAVAAVSGGADGMALATAAGDRFDTELLAELDPAWHRARIAAPAVPLSDGVLSTTGAGDAASAGLLLALLTGSSPEAALRTAGTVAARRIGGGTADPTR